MLPMTHHAQARLQQRGIPAQALESLLNYGRQTHDHHGATILYFDHRAREALKRESGGEGYRRMERHLGTYAVLSGDGVVVTVGHRKGRIRRH